MAGHGRTTSEGNIELPVIVNYKPLLVFVRANRYCSWLIRTHNNNKIIVDIFRDSVESYIPPTTTQVQEKQKEWQVYNSIRGHCSVPFLSRHRRRWMSSVHCKPSTIHWHDMQGLQLIDFTCKCIILKHWSIGIVAFTALWQWQWAKFSTSHLDLEWVLQKSKMTEDWQNHTRDPSDLWQ